MNVLCILLAAIPLILSCGRFTIQSEDDLRPQYILMGGLTATERIEDIRIRKLLRFTTNPDSTNSDPLYADVTHASVSIITEEGVALECIQQKGRYTNDHIVEEGKLYRISATILDSATKSVIALSSQTRIPRRMKSVSLSATVLTLDTPIKYIDIYNDIMFKTNSPKYPRLNLTLSSNPDEIHFITIDADSMSVDSIFKGQEVWPYYQYPFKGSNHPIVPLDLRLFGRHRLRIYHITNDFANAYVDLRIGDSWTIGDSQMPTEGISNVIGGDGIFGGFACDTLYFDVVKKTRAATGVAGTTNTLN